MEGNKEMICALSEIENIQMRVEHLQGLARTCAAAFSHKSLDGVSADDLNNTFESMHDQLEQIAAECGDLIIAITDHRAQLNY